MLYAINSLKKEVNVIQSKIKYIFDEVSNREDEIKELNKQLDSLVLMREQLEDAIRKLGNDEQTR